MLDDVGYEENKHEGIYAQAYPHIIKGKHTRYTKHREGDGKVNGYSLYIIFDGVVMLTYKVR